MAAADIISNYLEETKAQLIQSYISKGLKASGSFERGLQSSVRDTGRTIHGEITSEGHAWFMQEGRRPNAQQTAKEARGLGKILEQWVKDKGISVNPYAAAWKIVREGIKVPSSRNAGTVFTEVLTEEWEKTMIDRVSTYYVKFMGGEITTDLKKLIAK